MAEDGKVSFELVSPEELVVSEDVTMVVVPGAGGRFGVLDRHTPLISSLAPGVVALHRSSDRQNPDRRFFVDSGFAEVTANRCTVLAEHAVDVAELNRGEVETALKNAREDLADAKDDKERRDAEQRIVVNEAKLRALAA